MSQNFYSKTKRETPLKELLTHVIAVGLQSLHALGYQLVHTNRHACGQVDENTLLGADHVGAIRALPIYIFPLKTDEEIIGEIGNAIRALLTNNKGLQTGQGRTVSGRT